MRDLHCSPAVVSSSSSASPTCSRTRKRRKKKAFELDAVAPSDQNGSSPAGGAPSPRCTRKRRHSKKKIFDLDAVAASDKIGISSSGGAETPRCTLLSQMDHPNNQSRMPYWRPPRTASSPQLPNSMDNTHASQAVPPSSSFVGLRNQTFGNPTADTNNSQWTTMSMDHMYGSNRHAYTENQSADVTHVPVTQSAPMNSQTPGQIQMHVSGGAMVKGKEKVNKKTEKDGDRIKAVWDDFRHKVFIKLCVQQVKKGHKPHHTLNKVGYRELEEEFYTLTGCRYLRDQLKNHWDAVRRDWQAWQALKKETGMGWDSERGTYSQTDEWWKDFGKRYVGGEKFRFHPLAYEDELDVIFQGGAAVGEKKFIPSSGAIPLDDNSEDPPTEFLDGNEFVDSPPLGAFVTGPLTAPSLGDESTEQRSGRRKRKGMGEKRARASAAVRFETSMQQVCDILVARSNVFAPTEDDDPYSMKNAIRLLNENPEIVDRSNEWWCVIDAFDQAVARRKFVLLESHERRAEWVRRECAKTVKKTY